MLVVAAIDRRVKVVLSQGPCVSGWENFHRLVRPDLIPELEKTFAAGTVFLLEACFFLRCGTDVQADRIARLEGKEAGRLPIVSADLYGPCALNGKDVYDFFMEWEKKSTWKSDITFRS